MKKEKQNNGFTLLELLAIILIIGIVVGITGYVMTNIISNSKEKTNTLAMQSIKTSAKIYIEEYPDNIIWKEKANSTDTYACISTNELVNKGYLTKEDIKNTNGYFVITRNENHVIINEVFDQNGVCSTDHDNNKVPIPTAKEYCKKDLVYNQTEQELTQGDEISFSFSGNKQTQAGAYKVQATLNTGYIWKDGTTDVKTFTCSIKKATPVLTLSSDGDGGSIGDTEVTLKLDVPIAGNISVKSSDQGFATADLSSFDKTTGEAKIIIHKLATRKANTYITITFTPEDNQNYYSNSAVYTIGEVEKKVINFDDFTVDNVCSNPYYNGNYQYITKSISLNSGYEYYGNYQKEIGEYTVSVHLKYGSVWSNETTEDKEFSFICPILRPSFVVTYDDNGGTGCDSIRSSSIAYDSVYGNPPSTCSPSKTGYTFAGWYTAASGGTKVESTTKMTRLENHTLYAHWTANSYTVTYNSNGGNACSPSTKTVTYDQAYGTLCTPSRTGYKFNGWSTAGGTSVTKDTIYQTAGNTTLYANWTANVCTINFAPNGGTFNKNATNTVQTLNYGQSTTGDAGIWNANGGTYSATKTGYHIDSATAWIRTSDNVTFDETKNYSATDFCPSLASGDQSVTLNVNWKANVCTINFNANGGTFASGVSTVKTLNYGESWTDLWNALGTNSHFKGTAKSGYPKINNDRAWINSSTKAKYSNKSDVTYSALAFCPDLESGNQTITLKANWYRRQQKVYDSCASGSSCSYYSCNCTCADPQTGIRSNTFTGNYSSCDDLCADKNQVGPSGSCPCVNTCSGAWGKWTTVNSCSASSTVKCRNNYYLAQS